MIELPGYIIEKQLGLGGMARVYLARHIGLDRLIAMKTLSEDLDGDYDDAKDYLAEARKVKPNSEKLKIASDKLS